MCICFSATPNVEYRFQRFIPGLARAPKTRAGGLPPVPGRQAAGMASSRRVTRTPSCQRSRQSSMKCAPKPTRSRSRRSSARMQFNSHPLCRQLRSASCLLPAEESSASEEDTPSDKSRKRKRTRRIVPVIEDAVIRSHRIMTAATAVLAYEVLRCLENDEEIPASIRRFLHGCGYKCVLVATVIIDQKQTFILVAVQLTARIHDSVTEQELLVVQPVGFIFVRVTRHLEAIAMRLRKACRI